jgi:hypothetical protein
VPRTLHTRPSPRIVPRTSEPMHVRGDHRVLALVSLALAVVSVVLAVVEAYDVGAVVALAGVLVGGWSQMVSDTRGERFESVTGVVVAAVTLAVCLSYGSGVWT